MLRELFNRLDYCNFLIQHRATGTPKELGKKLGLSESSTYNLIKELKELGCPIDYDKCGKSYYYIEPDSFNIKFLRGNAKQKNQLSTYPLRQVLRRFTGSISFILPVLTLEEVLMIF